MGKREGNVFRSLHSLLSAANVGYSPYIFQISVALTHCKISRSIIEVHLSLRPMVKLIFYGILIYVLYKLVFDFIIPVSRATGQIKSKIKEAQEQQRRSHEQQQQAETQQQFQQKTPPPDAEYIDFEEVRERE
jgi:hypothetical protein